MEVVGEEAEVVEASEEAGEVEVEAEILTWVHQRKLCHLETFHIPVRKILLSKVLLKMFLTLMHQCTLKTNNRFVGNLYISMFTLKSVTFRLAKLMRFWAQSENTMFQSNYLMM